MFRKAPVLFFLALFLAVGCQVTENPADFFQRIAPLPGVHLSLVENPPAGFQTSDLNLVYAHAHAGDSIWLLAPQESLEQLDANGEFRAWLRSLQAIHFHTPRGDVYWIPQHKGEDRLAFIQIHGLTPWADAAMMADLWWKKGEQARAGQQFQEAITAYETSLRWDPDKIETHVGLAAALLGRGRNEEALQHLLWAAARHPDDYWTQRLLGQAYLNLHRYALAIGPLTRAYLLRPDISDILIGIALALGRGGQREMALQVLRQAEERIDDPRQEQAIQALREEFSKGVSNP